jgi:hypothetical protein
MKSYVVAKLAYLIVFIHDIFGAAKTTAAAPKRRCMRYRAQSIEIQSGMNRRSGAAGAMQRPQI